MLFRSGKPLDMITSKIEPEEPVFEEDGYVHCETVKEGKKKRTVESWGTFIPEAGGMETLKAPVESYESLSELVLNAIDEGKAAFVEDEDGCYVLWSGFNNCICLGDLQQSALHILDVMLYTQDMGTLCDDLDSALGLGLDYQDTPYAKAYSEAMNAPLSISSDE